MSGVEILLRLTSFEQPALLPALLIASALWARRIARATGRAIAMVIVFTILLHFTAWFAYGTVRPLQAACALIGLALLIPIAVRSRRTYPLFVAGASLLSATALTASALLPIALSNAAAALAALANMALASAFWVGLLQDWQRFGSKARRTRPTGQSV